MPYCGCLLTVIAIFRRRRTAGTVQYGFVCSPSFAIVIILRLFSEVTLLFEKGIYIFTLFLFKGNRMSEYTLFPYMLNKELEILNPKHQILNSTKIPKERFVLIFKFRYWSLFRPGLCPGNPASPVGAYLEFSA